MRRRLGKFVMVPDTMDGWATRVLTIAVVLMMISVITLMQMVIGLRVYIEQSRNQRLSFQVEEQARQCQILRNQGDSLVSLRSLGC